MPGWEWVLPGLLLVAASMLLAGLVLPETTERVQRQCRCPTTGRSEFVGVVIDGLRRDHRAIDVTSCTCRPRPCSATSGASR